MKSETNSLGVFISFNFLAEPVFQPESHKMGFDAFRYVFWVSLDFWVSVSDFQVQSLTKFRNNMAFITQPITYQPEKRTQNPKSLGKPEKRIEARRSPIHDFQVEKQVQTGN